MIVVSDTSIITSLIHVGREQLLAELHGEVLLPPAVQFELSRTHAPIPGCLQVRPVHDLTTVARLKVELDLGEAEAIVLAQETKADLLLIDEKLGRENRLAAGTRASTRTGVRFSRVARSNRAGIQSCQRMRRVCLAPRKLLYYAE